MDKAEAVKVIDKALERLEKMITTIEALKVRIKDRYRLQSCKLYKGCFNAP